MCAQLYVELICKRSKKEGRPPNFHEFWSEEAQCIKALHKIKL
jgi:hypothetical protein